MRTFPAKFPGRCGGECGERIAKGDEVTYDDHVLVHAACAGTTLPDPTQPTRQPCPTCWLVGPCDCPED